MIKEIIRKVGIALFTIGFIFLLLSIVNILLLPFSTFFLLFGYLALLLVYRNYKKAFIEAMRMPLLVLLIFLSVYVLIQFKNVKVDNILLPEILDPIFIAVFIFLIFSYNRDICKEKDCKRIVKYARKSNNYLKCKNLENFALCFAQFDDEFHFVQAINRMSKKGLLSLSEKNLPGKYFFILSQFLPEKKNELIVKACKDGYKQACKEWKPQMWIGSYINGYKILDIIGEGGLSYVLKGEKNSVIYAIKIPKLNPSSFTTRNIKELLVDIKNEESILVQISQKTQNVVKIFAVHFDEPDLYSILRGDVSTYITNPPHIVLEYMAGGSADKYDFTNPSWRKVVYFVIAKIAEALSVIHESGYVHSDVKPQNILFTSPLPKDPNTTLYYLKSRRIEVKLSDLGSAVKIGDKAIQLTPEYASLEQGRSAILGGISPFDDIYALGATAFRLLTGKVLNSPQILSAFNDFFLTLNVNLLDPKLYITRDYSPLKFIEPDIANFIIYMTSPVKRPTAKEVYQFFYSKIF